MNKNKPYSLLKKQKEYKQLLAIVSFMAFVFVGSVAYAMNLEMKENAFIPEVRKTEKKELPMMEWIEKEFSNAGLNTNVAKCVLYGESRNNPNAINEKSIDLGIAQWSIQHIKSGYISLECSGSYKCSIRKMIEKVKKDKGYKDWYAYKDNSCGIYGKTFN